MVFNSMFCAAKIISFNQFLKSKDIEALKKKHLLSKLFLALVMFY